MQLQCQTAGVGRPQHYCIEQIQYLSAFVHAAFPAQRTHHRVTFDLFQIHPQEETAVLYPAVPFREGLCLRTAYPTVIPSSGVT